MKFFRNRFSLFCFFMLLSAAHAFAIPFADFNFDAAEFDVETELEFDDYTITVIEPKRKGKSISCAATFTFGDEKNYADLYFPKFTLNRDGSFKSGKCDYDSSIYCSDGLELYLDKAWLEKSGDSYILKCNKATVDVPFVFGKQSLITYQISVDMKGKILSSKHSFAKKLKLSSDDAFGISVNLNSIMIDENNTICANGEISSPKLNLHVTAKNHEIIYSDYSFAASFTDPFSFSNGSDNFSAKSINLQSKSKNNFWFGDVILTHNNREYPFEKMKYLSYGGGIAELESDKAYEWKSEFGEGEGLLLPDDKILNYSYRNGGFTLTLLSRFPNANGHYFKVDATIGSEKTFYGNPYGPDDEKYFLYGKTRVQPSIDIFGQGIHLHFNRDSGEYEISSGKIFFPANCALGSFVIRWTNIDTKGNVHFGGEFPNIIDFCNNAFEPKKIMFTADGILFTGKLYLNIQQNVFVDELLIGFDGTVKSFKTKPFGYDENIIAEEFYVMSQSSHLIVEQTKNVDGTLSKPILWQVFEDSMISSEKNPTAVPINDLRLNLSETSMHFFSSEYPFEKYYERLERQGGR